ASTFHETHEREAEVGEGRVVFPARDKAVVEVLPSLDAGCPEVATCWGDLKVVEQCLERFGLAGFDVLRIYKRDIPVDDAVNGVGPGFTCSIGLGARVRAVEDELACIGERGWMVEVQGGSLEKVRPLLAG